MHYEWHIAMRTLCPLSSICPFILLFHWPVVFSPLLTSVNLPRAPKWGRALLPPVLVCHRTQFSSNGIHRTLLQYLPIKLYAPLGKDCD